MEPRTTVTIDSLRRSVNRSLRQTTMPTFQTATPVPSPVEVAGINLRDTPGTFALSTQPDYDSDDATRSFLSDNRPTILFADDLTLLREREEEEERNRLVEEARRLMAENEGGTIDSDDEQERIEWYYAEREREEREHQQQIDNAIADEEENDPNLMQLEHELERRRRIDHEVDDITMVEPPVETSRVTARINIAINGTEREEIRVAMTNPAQPTIFSGECSRFVRYLMKWPHSVDNRAPLTPYEFNEIILEEELIGTDIRRYEVSDGLPILDRSKNMAYFNLNRVLYYDAQPTHDELRTRTATVLYLKNNSFYNTIIRAAKFWAMVFFDLKPPPIWMWPSTWGGQLPDPSIRIDFLLDSIQAPNFVPVVVGAVYAKNCFRTENCHYIALPIHAGLNAFLNIHEGFYLVFVITQEKKLADGNIIIGGSWIRVFPYFVLPTHRMAMRDNAKEHPIDQVTEELHEKMNGHRLWKDYNENGTWYNDETGKVGRHVHCTRIIVPAETAQI